MNISELMDLEWNDVRSMSRKDLSKVVSQMASAANKRLRRFEQAGEISPAYRYAEKAGNFSVKGKNVNQLRAEYVRAKTFLQAETSSLRKWDVVKRDTVNTLSDMGVEIPKEDIGEVMRVYGKVKSEFPDIADSQLYAPAIQQIYDQMQQGVPVEDIINDARNTLITGYENRERYNNAFESGGVSDFF